MVAILCERLGWGEHFVGGNEMGVEEGWSRSWGREEFGKELGRGGWISQRRGEGIFVCLAAKWLNSIL